MQQPSHGLELQPRLSPDARTGPRLHVSAEAAALRQLAFLLARGLRTAADLA